MLIEEAEAIFRSSGDKWALAIVLANLCHILVACDEFDRAVVAAREGVLLCKETVDRRSLTWCLFFLGVAMVRRNETERAVRLWGAVEGISQFIGSPLPSLFLATRDPHLSAARETLGNEPFAGLWAEGRAMTPDAAIAYALSDDDMRTTSA